MSTAATELVRQIRRARLRVFTTADLITLTGLTRPAATQALRRLATHGLATHLKRGWWLNQMADDLHPYELVPPLTAPWPAYVSLHSALADAGVIEEIPAVTYAVTAGRPQRAQTQLGDVQIHHLPARLMWGYAVKQAGDARYPLADPEKAFLDLVYLALTPRSAIRLPYTRRARWPLDRSRLQQYARRFSIPAVTRYLTMHRIL